MENGVERVAGEPELVEQENVESRVTGDAKVEEKAVIGSDRSKDGEDEVFEEAIGSEEQLLSRGVKVELEDVVENENYLVLKSTDENLNIGSEVEIFEEAVDVDAPTASAGKPEELGGVGGEEEVKDLVGGGSVDRIDEGSITDVGLSRESILGYNEENEPKKNESGSGIEYHRTKRPVETLIERQEDKNEGVDENLLTTDTECSFEKNEELEVDTPVLDHTNGVYGSERGINDFKSMEMESQNDSNGDINDASVLLDSVHQVETNELDTSSAVEHADEAIPVPEILNSHPLGVVNDNSEEILTHEGNIQADNIKVPEPPHVDGNANGVSKGSVVTKRPEMEAEKELKEEQTTQEREILPPTKIASSSEESSGGKELDTTSSSVLHAEKAISVSGILNSQSTEVVNGNSEEISTHEDNLQADSIKVPEPPHIDQRVNGVSKDNIAVNQPETEAEREKKEKQTIQESKILPQTKIASSSEKSAGSATTPARPAGLGRAAPLLEPAARSVQQQPRGNGTMSNVQSQQVEEPTNGDGDEYDETREKLQMIRVKFLRLAHRLGQTPHNVVVAQVLYRLGLAEQLRGRNGGRVGAFSFDRASAMAEQLEASGQEPLDFSCTIMVLGKTGVGKSATINSLFDEVKFGTDAFQMGTKKVQDVVGTVQGIKVRVIDTPGLLPSGSDQRQNEKILHSVKRFIKSTPPDIVLYLDRLDMQSRDFGDMPLLRTITEIFGPSIWFNAIVVLTHAASAPPDGPNGTASSYDMFVTQRSHVVQQAIRQAAGDMRLMNPVSLVENHSACRTNRAGQRVLPNGQVWKPHLLLLSFASKILAEANALLKLQDSPPGKPFAARSRSASLPFLLSSLLQPRPQLKLPEEQFGDDDDLDDDFEDSEDSEDDSEFEDLPPFRSLTKAQVAKLTRAQKKAYFDELEYREELFMKKQLKEEKKRRKMMKKMAASTSSEYNETPEEESGSAASVPVPMPDLALPVSFDSDNPTHRYRYLDTSNQWLVRPVLETHGWDHDVGYEGINVERLFVVKDKIPLSLSGQVTKDKKDANVQMEIASSIKHGEGKSTSLGFDMQTVGKDLAYTLRSETRFCNFRKNKATAGLSVTLLGDALSAGLKVEDKLIANKRFRMVVSGGAMTGRGDVAYGGSLEAQLRDKDYPLGRSLSTLGLSIMDWHGDLAIGCNIQSQVPVGRSTNLIARGNLNNRGSGQISIRVNSSEQLQIALIGLLPLLKKMLYGNPQQGPY